MLFVLKSRGLAHGFLNLCLIKKTLNRIDHQSLVLNWPVLILGVYVWLTVTETEALQARERAECVI